MMFIYVLILSYRSILLLYFIFYSLRPYLWYVYLIKQILFMYFIQLPYRVWYFLFYYFHHFLWIFLRFITQKTFSHLFKFDEAIDFPDELFHEYIFSIFYQNYTIFYSFFSVSSTYLYSLFYKIPYLLILFYLPFSPL